MPNTAIKEHPLLMRGDMVRPTLADIKRQTRRILTPRNSYPGAGSWKTHDYDFTRARVDGPEGLDRKGNQYLHVPFCLKQDGWEDNPEDDTIDRIRCKWKTGDHIWVKETLQSWCYDPVTHGTRYAATPEVPVIEPSTGKERRWLWEKETLPSIFMPRDYSRILLEITGIRSQMVKEISDDDALAEGIGSLPVTPGIDIDIDGNWWNGQPRKRFKDLWNSINGKPKPIKGEDGRVAYYESYPFEDIQEMRTYRGKPWIVRGNPRVWVIDFKRI